MNTELENTLSVAMERQLSAHNAIEEMQKRIISIEQEIADRENEVRKSALDAANGKNGAEKSFSTSTDSLSLAKARRAALIDMALPEAQRLAAIADAAVESAHRDIRRAEFAAQRIVLEKEVIQLNDDVRTGLKALIEISRRNPHSLGEMLSFVRLLEWALTSEDPAAAIFARLPTFTLIPPDFGRDL